MKMKAIKTVKNSDLIMAEVECPAFEASDAEWGMINVVPQVEYQTIDGFGGAFTEATAVSLDKISPENRAKVIKMYFDKEEGLVITIAVLILTAVTSLLATGPMLKRAIRTFLHSQSTMIKSLSFLLLKMLLHTTRILSSFHHHGALLLI